MITNETKLFYIKFNRFHCLFFLFQSSFYLSFYLQNYFCRFLLCCHFILVDGMKIGVFLCALKFCIYFCLHTNYTYIFYYTFFKSTSLRRAAPETSWRFKVLLFHDFLSFFHRTI